VTEPAKIRFHCVSNPLDSNADADLPHSHSLFREAEFSNYMEKKSQTTLVFVLVLLIITWYYIHHHILRKSKYWNHWIAIYRCLYILNTTLDDMSRFHLAFSIIQTSVNSYSMCICLLPHDKRQTAMSDEWELYATNDKSRFDINESVNSSRFGFAQNCRILTTFEFGFELRHIPCG